MDPVGSTPPPARNRGLGRAPARAPRGRGGARVRISMAGGWKIDDARPRARENAERDSDPQPVNRSIGRSRARQPKTRTGRSAAAPQKKTRPMMGVELIDEKEKLKKKTQKKGRAAAVAGALSVTTRVCRATAIPSVHHPSQIAHPPIGRSKTPARARRPHPRVVRQGRRTPAK